jgi:hypothetical protein
MTFTLAIAAGLAALDYYLRPPSPWPWFLLWIPVCLGLRRIDGRTAAQFANLPSSGEGWLAYLARVGLYALILGGLRFLKPWCGDPGVWAEVRALVLGGTVFFAIVPSTASRPAEMSWSVLIPEAWILLWGLRDVLEGPCRPFGAVSIAVILIAAGVAAIRRR